jgi:arsenate reductase (thioredoxin)
VLFVCLGNACRSQMAEAFARVRAGDVLQASSAGLLPSRAISTNTRMVMREKQISMERHTPKMLDQMDLSRFHMIVNLSGRLLPRRRGRTIVDWCIPDPMGHDMESFRVVRDRIESLVMGLAEERRAAVAAKARQRRILLKRRLGWHSLWMALLVGLCFFSASAQAGSVNFIPVDFPSPQWCAGGDLWGPHDGGEVWERPPSEDSVAAFIYSLWLGPDTDQFWGLEAWASFLWRDHFPDTPHYEHGWLSGCWQPGGDLDGIPEPASVSLLVLGLALLIVTGRLRSNGSYEPMPSRVRVLRLDMRRRDANRS